MKWLMGKGLVQTQLVLLIYRFGRLLIDIERYKQYSLFSSIGPIDKMMKCMVCTNMQSQEQSKDGLLSNCT